MSELIQTLSLWTEFNKTVKEGYMRCGIDSVIIPSSEICDHSRTCDTCFFKVDSEQQDKTIESLDRHTPWLS